MKAMGRRLTKVCGGYSQGDVNENYQMSAIHESLLEELSHQSILIVHVDLFEDIQLGICVSYLISEIL